MWERKEVELNCIICYTDLLYIVDSSSSVLFTVLWPLSLPISLRPARYAMVGAGSGLADAHSSGWQMPGVSADALHQLMTDVRALLGRQHFITLPLFSAPLHTPACFGRHCAQPHRTIPPAPTHSHMHVSTSISQALLHQTNHHTHNQRITC